MEIDRHKALQSLLRRTQGFSTSDPIQPHEVREMIGELANNLMALNAALAAAGKPAKASRRPAPPQRP